MMAGVSERNGAKLDAPCERRTLAVCAQRRVVGVRGSDCSAPQRSASAVALTDERAEEHAGHHQRDGLVHVDQHNLDGLREKTDAAQTKVTEMAEGREKESETAAVSQIVAARAIAIGASDCRSVAHCRSEMVVRRLVRWPAALRTPTHSPRRWR